MKDERRTGIGLGKAFLKRLSARIEAQRERMKVFPEAALPALPVRHGAESWKA